MQTFIGIIINVVILTLALIVFYIYIAYKLREKIEDEAIKRVREELEGLVREFNNSALTNVTLLEDAIERANEAIKKMGTKKNDTQIDTKTSIYKSRNEMLDNYLERTNSNISLTEEKRVRLLSDEPLELSLKEIYISESIQALYQNGYSREEIATKLQMSLEDIDKY